MNQVFEAYSDEASLRDGGFIFQGILTYTMQWSIVNGDTVFDQKNVRARLHQVDVFPDLKFQKGYATLTYVILSEVNLLKRKIDLATEEIKKRLSPEYAKFFSGDPKEIEQIELIDPSFLDKEDQLLNQGQKLLDKGQAQLGPGQKQLGPGQKLLDKGQAQLGPGQKMLNPGQKALPSPVGESSASRYLTAAQKKAINDKYFKDTAFDVVFTVDHMVLREVSTSGLDTGAPIVTLKLSTGMVDTLDGRPINSWNGFKVVVSGNSNSMTIDNTGEFPISKIVTFDPIENLTEPIFRTILPSLILEFTGDKVAIESFTNRSSQVAIRSAIDFENLFEPGTKTSTQIEEPEEGEETEEKKDSSGDEGEEGEEISDSPNK